MGRKTENTPATTPQSTRALRADFKLTRNHVPGAFAAPPKRELTVKGSIPVPADRRFDVDDLVSEMSTAAGIRPDKVTVEVIAQTSSFGATHLRIEG